MKLKFYISRICQNLPNVFSNMVKFLSPKVNHDAYVRELLDSPNPKILLWSYNLKTLIKVVIIYNFIAFPIPYLFHYFIKIQFNEIICLFITLLFHMGHIFFLGRWYYPVKNDSNYSIYNSFGKFRDSEELIVLRFSYFFHIFLILCNYLFYQFSVKPTILNQYGREQLDFDNIYLLINNVYYFVFIPMQIESLYFNEAKRFVKSGEGKLHHLIDEYYFYIISLPISIWGIWKIEQIIKSKNYEFWQKCLHFPFTFKEIEVSLFILSVFVFARFSIFYFYYGRATKKQLLGYTYAPTESATEYLNFAPALTNPFFLGESSSQQSTNNNILESQLNIAKRLMLSEVYSLEDIASIVDIDIDKLKSLKQ